MQTHMNPSSEKKALLPAKPWLVLGILPLLLTGMNHILLPNAPLLGTFLMLPILLLGLVLLVLLMGAALLHQILFRSYLPLFLGLVVLLAQSGPFYLWLFSSISTLQLWLLTALCLVLMLGGLKIIRQRSPSAQAVPSSSVTNLLWLQGLAVLYSGICVLYDDPSHLIATILMQAGVSLVLVRALVLDFRRLKEENINLEQAISQEKGLKNQLDNQLSESNQHAQQIIHALDHSAIVAFTDANGLITHVNDKFCQISQYSEAELLGNNHRIINSGHHPPDFFKHMWQTIKSAQIWRGEILNRTKLGQYYWVDTTIVPIVNEEGQITHFLSIRFDITQHKNDQIQLQEANNRLSQSLLETERAKEEALQARQVAEALKNEAMLAKEEAERANLAKSRMIAVVSHDVRTPMSAILGLSEVLQDISLPQSAVEPIQSIRKSGELMMMLLDDLLDYSRIEAGGLSLKSQSFDLVETVEEVLNLPNTFNPNQLELVLVAEPGLPLLIGDQLRIKQILLNLLGNALKFTLRGEVVLEILTVGQEAHHIEVLFRVRDTGIGIAPEAIERLFQPFVQADQEIVSKFGGTGLGLSIAQRLVEMMGGQIKVESAEGQGTTFEFQILFEKDPQAPVGLMAPQAWQGKRVLLVEDNSANQCGIMGWLRYWGFEATLAESYRQALEVCQEKAQANQMFEVIMIDTCLPDLSGWNLAKAIDRYFPQSIIVMMAGMVETSAQPFLGSMPWYLIYKPIKPSGVFHSLQHMLVTSVSTAPAQQQSTESAFAGLRLLVAEDNEINQKLVQLLLVKLGCSQIVCVSTGREVLERLDDEEFDLLLMDCQMPEMDGFQATQQIRQRETLTGKHLPIVALTANVDDQFRQQCQDVGMDGFVGKPFRQKELEAELSRMLELKSGSLHPEVLAGDQKEISQPSAQDSEGGL